MNTPPPLEPPTGPPTSVAVPAPPPWSQPSPSSDPTNPPMPPFQQAPPPGAPAPTGRPARYRPQRPWWGFGDVLLGVPFFLALSIVGFVVGLALTGVDGLLDMADSGDMSALPLGILAFSLLFQQLGQGLWPIIVSRWKGLGPAADWRIAAKPRDLGIGVGIAALGLVGAGVAGIVTTRLVGLTDEAAADNTQFLREASGTPWLAAILFAAVIGAPITEELFFRGLTLRAVEKRLGSTWAVVLSAVIFTLPHFTSPDLRGTAVLFSSIFVVGLILGAITVKTERIAAAIVAHMIFNGVGAAAALGWFDQFGV
ncbi:MAG: CPBP family intramembrane metalloprotease [Acidimicrobiia bacterium]|nr:CPBP family intramembrane metalloprotease [Acidimicrobiia bacterium]